MYLTVLGSNGLYPTPGRACSGYLLESDSGNTRIVIDMGSGTLERLISIAKPDEISGLVLSHLHYDHMSDALVYKYLLQFSAVESVRLICPSTPANEFKLLQGGKLDTYPMQDMTLGEMELEFIKVKHPIEAYAARVKCDGSVLVYTGDSNECAELSIFCDGADLLLGDAGLLERNWKPSKPHLSAERLAKLALESRVGALLATHLSPLNEPREILDELTKIYPSATLAEPGLRVRV